MVVGVGMAAEISVPLMGDGISGSEVPFKKYQALSRCRVVNKIHLNPLMVWY